MTSQWTSWSGDDYYVLKRDLVHAISTPNSHSSVTYLRQYSLCICNAKGTVKGAHSASTARIPGLHFPFLCSTNKQLMYWIYSTSVHLGCISHQWIKKLTLFQVQSIHFWATEQNISVNTWNWVPFHLFNHSSLYYFLMLKKSIQGYETGWELWTHYKPNISRVGELTVSRLPCHRSVMSCSEFIHWAQCFYRCWK
jgi:hypothetical protein